MNLRSCLLALALGLTIPSSAEAVEFEPPSGLGMMITGGIMSGVGAMNLLTMPICFADVYESALGSTAKRTCLIASGAYAAVGLGVGVPLFFTGKKRRAAYKEWRLEHNVSLAVTPQPQGGAIVWSGRF